VTRPCDTWGGVLTYDLLYIKEIITVRLDWLGHKCFALSEQAWWEKDFFSRMSVGSGMEDLA
jgi:hypothetical protein